MVLPGLTSQKRLVDRKKKGIFFLKEKRDHEAFRLIPVEWVPGYVSSWTSLSTFFFVGQIRSSLATRKLSDKQHLGIMIQTIPKAPAGCIGRSDAAWNEVGTDLVSNNLCIALTSEYLYVKTDYVHKEANTSSSTLFHPPPPPHACTQHWSTAHQYILYHKRRINKVFNHPTTCWSEEFPLNNGKSESNTTNTKSWDHLPYVNAIPDYSMYICVSRSLEGLTIAFSLYPSLGLWLGPMQLRLSWDPLDGTSIVYAYQGLKIGRFDTRSWSQKDDAYDGEVRESEYRTPYIIIILV